MMIEMELKSLWARMKGLSGDDLRILIAVVYGYCEARPERHAVLERMRAWVDENERARANTICEQTTPKTP